MLKFNIRWKTAEDFNILRGKSALTKVKYFWRKGWIEVPALMCSGIYTVVGLGILSYVFYYESKYGIHPKYFRSPRIYRPDDPEAQNIQHKSNFD